MEIKNHLLFIDGIQVPFKRSPNVGGVIIPTYLIMHYTAADTASSAINWMLDPASKVSAHLHLDREGKFVQLVPFNIRAQHAGESSWKDIIGLNSHSIGVEMQNTGKQEYTNPQLDALLKFCQAAVVTYKIKEILGHSDIAPKRKTDPGKQFPMQWLRDEAWPTAENAVMKNTTTDVNIRKGPGANNDKITTLAKDTEVVIIDENNGWSEVFVCSLKIKGYISNAYLK